MNFTMICGYHTETVCTAPMVLLSNYPNQLPPQMSKTLSILIGINVMPTSHIKITVMSALMITEN
jgi:hypothetical protein